MRLAVELKKASQTQKTKLQTTIGQNTLSSHLMTVVRQEQIASELLNAKGELRRHRLRPTKAQCNYDVRWPTDDIPEAGQLTQTSPSQIIYSQIAVQELLGEAHTNLELGTSTTPVPNEG